MMNTAVVVGRVAPHKSFAELQREQRIAEQRQAEADRARFAGEDAKRITQRKARRTQLRAAQNRPWPIPKPSGAGAARGEAKTFTRVVQDFLDEMTTRPAPQKRSTIRPGPNRRYPQPEGMRA